MTTLFHIPNTPIEETWQWRTDVMSSANNTEQRVENSELPKCIYRLTYQFDSAPDLREMLRVMGQMGTAFDIPLFQYQTRIKAEAEDGDDELSIISARTNLRQDGKFYVFDRDGGEILTALNVAELSVTSVEELSRDYKFGTNVCPIVTVYNAGAAAIDRLNPDAYASGTFVFSQVDFTDPFLNEFNEAELTMFAGLPVLESRPIGTSFSQGFETGAEVIDYGGVVSIRNLWLHAVETFPKSFICERTMMPNDWDLWRKFADYAKGSCNPFFMPTYREDFVLTIDPVAGGNTLRLQGLSYLNNYFPHSTYKQIAITTAAGVHYATVTAAAANAGNTALTFAPALPAGAEWGVEPVVSLLLKCRIADDKVSCKHFDLHTEIALQLRTVDE